MRRRLVCLLTALGLLASACASSSDAAEVAAPETTASTPDTTLPETTTTAPETTAPPETEPAVETTTTTEAATTTTALVDTAEAPADDNAGVVGQQVDLSGDTDLVLWFWAPW